jgi:hypothetical protein
MHFAFIILSCLSTELWNHKVGSIRKGKTDGHAETDVVETACIKKATSLQKNGYKRVYAGFRAAAAK